MKNLKQILELVVLTIIMTSFSQCSSAQKLQNKAPTAFGEIYFQKWIAGVEGGGSGVNIVIETLNSNVKLDSVYFHGKVAKLEVKPNNELIYIGRFISEFNKKENMVISFDTKQEYGNKAPVLPKKIPFELKDDECVVSYLESGKTKYYKLSNIIEKRSMDIPMSPNPNNN